MSRWILRATLLLASVLLAPPAHAYIEAAYSIGRIINDATTIVLMKVESVDKTRNTITYKKIEDIKGKHNTDTIKHNIGQSGFHPREWQNIMAWAQPGQHALFFHNGSASETCIQNYWYQCYPGGEWWNHNHAEPYLLRSFAGRPERLAGQIKQMLAGQEVVITAMVDGDRNALHMRTARLVRIKASLKLLDYDQKRDFVGWGSDEMHPITSMPAFSAYATMSRLSPGAGAAQPVDIDGDGKPGFLLLSENRTALYVNDGTAMSEVLLPVSCGARGAAAAAFRGGKLRDLLLAAPAGVKLLTNLGGGKFRDDSAALPAMPYANPTACAVIDYDGDGRPDILLADGFAGLRLYRNVTPAAAAKDSVPKFEDVTNQAGLAQASAGFTQKISAVLTGDFHGTGRPDLLLIADGPRVLANTGTAYSVVSDTGLNFCGGKFTPAAGLLGKHLYLAVPQPGASTSKLLLYRCAGRGRFVDVTRGPLLSFPGQATSVSFCDFDKSGAVDLLVGVLRAPNRFFRNRGDNTFDDASEEIGLTQRIFNTTGITALDFGRRGVLDLVLNNEAQDPVLLYGNPARKGLK